jgi:hypothetical protein
VFTYLHTGSILLAPDLPNLIRTEIMTTQIAEYSPTEAALAELRTELSNVLFDCETPKGMKEADEAFRGAIKQMEAMHIAALDRVDLERRAAAAPPVEQSEPEANTPDTDPHPPQQTSVSVPVRSSVLVRPEPITLVKGEGVPLDAPYIQAASAKEEACDNLLKCAKAVCAHYGKFKTPHSSISDLESAIKQIESV